MAKGIYERSPELKKKMALNLPSRSGCAPWNKGTKGLYKLSSETLKKISGSSNHNFGKKMPIYQKLALSVANRERVRSPEELAKMANSLKERYKDKSKHPRWEGGISKDPAHLKKKTKEWVLKNYDRKLWLNSQRRVRKMGNGGFHTLEEWQTLKNLLNSKCVACGKTEPETKLTRDHIVPLSKGGTDYISNIQPLCRSCNSRKNAKIIAYVV